MKLLTGEEIPRALETVPGWGVEGDILTRTFCFSDFVEAVRFVDGAALIAEELGHHPDVDIRYNKVKVGLTTHDAGGLTELDFRLASRLSTLENETSGS